MADNHGQALSPRRNMLIDRPKLYEEMLLKEISAKRRTNEPMHAILEAELGESETVDGLAGQSIRNHALIHYLATLANSNNTNDTFDFDFVESLLENGADVNSTDKTGQTIFHEIARSWNIDVVTFLLKHGADVNQKDHFGRSPLHVAAAVDYADMVEFLLQHGADINIRTVDEGQTPIHFAAKNDAINSLQMLLAYGADIDSRDSKNRTPLQVSAQMNRSKTAKHLINEGAPVGVYDDVGNSALSLLIEKIPDVALEALDQFHSSDNINRKQFYFLNYLEGTKLKEVKTNARTPLEIAVQNERFEIILHPVMKRLISVKWRMYGKWGAILDLVLNLFYTVLWSVFGVTIPKTGNEMYVPLKDNSWRVVIGILLILLTILEIRLQITNTVKTRQEFTAWREWRADELERDFEYCHPRWPQETEYLQSEIKGVRNLSFITDSDWWIYFDWLALLLILATIVSHVIFFHYSTIITKEVHEYIIIALILILWLRIFKYARPFEGAGPFVVIFGSVLGDIVKWAFLNLVILIPYTCAFWIIFGANSPDPVESYSNVSPLLYNVFSMMVVGSYNYEELEKAHATMARLLCGTFIVIAAIITLNLLIALLTNTFERHYENAVANAVMQRARTILLLQKSLRQKEKEKYYDFIRLNGSPEVIRNDIGRFTVPDVDDRATIERVREDVEAVKNILGERLGTKFGKKGKKSDMEFVKMDVCKLRVCQEELVTDTRNMKMALHDIKETIEFLKNNWNSNNNNSNNNGNDNTNCNNGKNNVVSSAAKIPPTKASTVVNQKLKNKITMEKKLGKNAKDRAKKDSETENMRKTGDSSESSSDKEWEQSRRKKSSKNQDNKENHQKKKKSDHHSDDDDDDGESGTNKQPPSNKEKGDYRMNQQFANRAGDWQSPRQGSWQTDGAAQNMSNHAYPPNLNQTTPPFSPFRRNYDDHDGIDNRRGFQDNVYGQPYFSKFNQRLTGRRHENESLDVRHVEDARYRRLDENQNISSSRYDIQRVGGRIYDNTRAHQPVFPATRDDIHYPGNLYESESVQNDQRVSTRQYFGRTGGRRNDGYEGDEWRNQRQSQRFSSNDFDQVRYIPEQSGCTNAIYGSVNGDVPTSKPNNQSRSYPGNDEQELRAYPYRSESVRLTETRQQSAWSKGLMQTQGHGYQELDSVTDDYHPYATTVAPKRYPAFAPTRPPPPREVVNITSQDDRRISPMPRQVSRSPSELEVGNSNSDIPTQSQLYGVSEKRQRKVDETDVRNKRGLTTLSRESRQRMPKSVDKIEDIPRVSVTPRHFPSPAPPNQITENQNSMQQLAPPVILSHPATLVAPEMGKVEYFERRSSTTKAEEIHSTGVSSQKNFPIKSHRSSETKYQSSMSGHSIADKSPMSSQDEIDDKSFVPRQYQIDVKGTGDKEYEDKSLDQDDSEKMLRMKYESQNVTEGNDESAKIEDESDDDEEEEDEEEEKQEEEEQEEQEQEEQEEEGKEQEEQGGEKEQEQEQEQEREQEHEQDQKQEQDQEQEQEQEQEQDDDDDEDSKSAKQQERSSSNKM